MKQFYFVFLFIGFSLFTNTQTPTGNSNEVGITEGQLSVSLTGGATYNIPIAVPPGINNIVPQIALAYNSQGGNGRVGYGWNITGISTITRIPSTKFHDGIIDGVDFDNLDRFAFNGQRLVVKNGTSGIYGENGTIYETENFSNVQITSYGVHPSGANYGPSYFIVEYPDGSKAYYGYSTDSRTIMEYSITYWEDPQGVRISYTYNNSNNNLNIATINYGTLGATIPINKIQFNYVTAKHPEQVYVGGQSVTNNSILDNIVVTGNSIGFRSYNLVYGDTSLAYQRLIKITEKSGDGTKSLNPTVFVYEDTPSSINYLNTTTTLDAPSNTSASNTRTVMGDFDGDGAMDFALYPTTGTDAKKKFKLYTKINNSLNIQSMGTTTGEFKELFASTWLTQFNTVSPQQGITAVIHDPISPNIVNFNTYTYSSLGVSLQYTKSITFPYTQRPSNCLPSTTEYLDECTQVYSDYLFPKKYLSGDFNGDGLTDVISIDVGSVNVINCDRYDLPDGTPYCTTFNSTMSTGYVYFVDLKRDLTNTTPFLTGSLDSSSLDVNSDIQVVDFNGDGKSDFLIRVNNRIKVYGLDNNNYLVLLTDLFDTNITLNKKFLLGDYNGDGKTDFLMSKNEPSSTLNTEWYVYTSTGSSYTSVLKNFTGLVYPSLTPNFGYQYIPNDINNDGKTDLIYVEFYRPANSGPSNVGTLHVDIISNINGDLSVNTNSFIDYFVNNVINVDANGLLNLFYSSIQNNQKLEIATITSDPMLQQKVSLHYFQSSKDFSREKLLKTITTGNGVKETISYKALQSEDLNPDETDSSHYLSVQNLAMYPNLDIQVAPSFQIVSKIEKQSSSTYKKQFFSYYGVVSNTEGLGFLGFRTTAKTNWIDDNNFNSIITTVSKFDTNLRGANTENYTALGYIIANGLAAPSSYISKSNNTYNMVNGTFEDPLQNNKVFKLKNTSSQQYNGLENTSTETSVVYDAYNNPTQSTTLVKEGGTTQQTTISNLTYATPTGSPYIIGRPTNKTQSVVISGDTMTSEEQYTYNTSGLLTQVKKKGHNTNFITEDNIYDTFGNITKKTITATGLTPRETNYEYDTSGRFLTKNIDVESLATTYNYNTANGVLNSETNPYGLTTSYLYDSWFKKIKTTDYLGKNNTYGYIRNTEKTKITVTGDDGSYSEELYDDLGRKITASVKDINDNLSNVSYLYDIYDRNVKVSEPYSVGSPTQWNEIQYDVYGRPTQNISFTGKTTSISYSGLTTTVNDGTKTKIATKNAIGNVVTMTDSPGGTINYIYFANGNLKSSDYGGIVTTIEQDGWGRKTKLTDSSAGIYIYTYNELGEALTETTPNGTTTYALNNVGKPSQKTIVGTNTNSTTSYVYDSVTKLLTSNTFVDFLENNATTTTTYTYDSSKRLANSIETTPYATFTKQLTYDTFGRLNIATSIANSAGKSSSKAIQRTYKNGQPWQIIDSSNSQILWQTNTVNVRGQLTGATMANGYISVSYTYDSYGLVTQTKQDRLIVSPGNIMTLNTVFDSQTRNLTSRTNSLFNWSESFTYDSLDRLISFKNTAGVTETQNYDDRGRITQNAIGTYNYTNTNKVYQNTSVDVTPDAKNYYTINHEQNITYNAFKSPYQIEEVGKDKISFTYNDNSGRSAMFYGSLNNDKLLRPLRKYYSGNGDMEIKHNIQTGDLEFVTYIGGDGYTAPIVLKSDGTTQNYLYLQRDYQGSIVAVSDASGQVLEKRLFDAWGNVLVQDGASNTLNGLTILDRGYTGHEHLQSVGLIHMNGRLYDAKLHRFLQPDNFVQDPNNTQNFNRYGYCYNNPLKYTDVTGEWFGLDDLVVAGASFIIGYVGNGLSTGKWGWSSVKAGLISAAAGWLAYNTAGASTGITAGSGTLNAAMGNFIINQAASVAISYFIPPIGIQVGDWSFSISPAIAFGNASGIGASLSVTYSSGNFSFSGGIGIMSNSNYNGLGKNGLEIRKSILASYDDGKNGVSLGSNIWSGDFAQTTGVVGLHFGDFRAMYENDGGPVLKHLGDANDSYRTAALNLSVGNFNAGFNLFTGARPKSLQVDEEASTHGYKDRFGVNHRNAPVNEIGTRYRLGALTVGYGGYRVGVNSEHVRHAIQNSIIHRMIGDNEFMNTSWDWKGYSQYRTSNGFTSW